MFSKPSDSKSILNHQSKIVVHKRKKEEELKGRAKADVDAFDKKPVSHQPLRKKKKPTQDQLSHDELNSIISETKKPSYAPTSTNRFVFFDQIGLPVTAFLNYVVHGDLEEAKALLEKNPSLVLYKGQVTDFSGRIIEGTGYQIALGAEDVSRKKYPKEGMADVIREYFIKALDNDEESSNEEIHKQIKEQFPKEEFPEYYETNEKKRAEILKRKEALDPDIKELEKLAKTILHADEKEIKATPTGQKNEHGSEEHTLEVTGECRKALQAFRDYLKPKAVIKKGKHFNAQLFFKALEKYVGEQYNLFGGHWYDPKNLLFLSQVIGYIERYFPANLAQASCQKLYNATNCDDQSLKRNLILENKPFFYPTDLSSPSGLGFDYAVFNCSGSSVGYTGFVGKEALIMKQLRQVKTVLFHMPMQHVENGSEKNASCRIL